MSGAMIGPSGGPLPGTTLQAMLANLTKGRAEWTHPCNVRGASFAPQTPVIAPNICSLVGAWVTVETSSAGIHTPGYRSA